MLIRPASRKNCSHGQARSPADRRGTSRTGSRWRASCLARPEGRRRIPRCSRRRARSAARSPSPCHSCRGTLLVADALVHGLDGEAGRGRQGGVLPEHPLDRGGVRPELGIAAASRPVRLRVRMGEHLANGLPTDAGFPNDLPARNPSPGPGAGSSTIARHRGTCGVTSRARGVACPPAGNDARATRERHRAMRSSIALPGQFFMSPEAQFLVSLDSCDGRAAGQRGGPALAGRARWSWRRHHGTDAG